MQEFYDHLSLYNGDLANPEARAIKVMTIHSSKGLEFEFVFLPFWVNGSVPSSVGT